MESYTTDTPETTTGKREITPPAPAESIMHSSRILYVLIYRLSRGEGFGGFAQVTIPGLARMLDKSTSFVDKHLFILRSKGWIKTSRGFQKLYITPLVIATKKELAQLEDVRFAPPKDGVEFTRIHDEFTIPLSCLNGKNAEADQKKGGFIYLLKSEDLYKIGRTSKLTQRIAAIRTSNASGVEYIASYRTTDAVHSENHWHNRFAHYHVRGEWFRLFEDQVKEFTDHCMKMEAE